MYTLPLKETYLKSCTVLQWDMCPSLENHYLFQVGEVDGCTEIIALSDLFVSLLGKQACPPNYQRLNQRRDVVRFQMNNRHNMHNIM